MEPDLVTITNTVPGTGKVCAWTLNDRRLEAFPPAHAVIGVIWTIPHAVDTVQVFFDKKAPQPVGNVQVFDGKRWRVWTSGLHSTINQNEWNVVFSPVITKRIRIAVPADSRPKQIAIYRYQASGDATTWPDSVTTGRLARELLAQDKEPSFETLGLHGLSMPNWASIGLKDSPYEQAVAWNGEIHCMDRRISLTLGSSAVGLGDVRDTVHRRLLDGWMPAVTVEGRIADIAVTQTVFAVYADGKAEKLPAMFVRVQVRNVGDKSFEGPLGLRVSDAPENPFQGTLGVKVFAPARDQSHSEWTFDHDVLIRNGRPFLASSAPCYAGKEPSTVTVDMVLAPGKTRGFLFVAPLLPWHPTAAQANRLARMPFADALARFRAYWSDIMAPAMKLDLPEARLNHVHRAVLAQILISADNDILPYGAAPSTYDGSVYGVEEGYSMRLLAMSGFADDVKRYLDATYLRREFLAKADLYTRVEDRNQQIKNGLIPMYAVELFRLTGDQDWIVARLDLLKECAEWTIVNRRKTMAPEDGKRPLHYGLLPRWAFGGDIHDACYPLYPNFACWRGLADTAWLMAEIGETDLAARYQSEADDYHETLINIVDKITRKDPEPPFMPLHTAATVPAPDHFYQLFGSLLMDLLPFKYSDVRSGYVGDFIEADNRTFCGLPRVDVGKGGLDAIYGLGHIMGFLHRNRIREFQLALYAYLVFNMEHACFTSRESNRIFSSDLHLRTPHCHSDWTGPLPCASAVGALLVRHMVVTEETRGAAEYTGNLLLLYGAPRRWYKRGNRISVKDAVTHAGKVGFTVETAPDHSRIRAEIVMSDERRCLGIKIRLRHPEGKPMQRVTINGVKAATFDTGAELVYIPNPNGTIRIIAFYACSDSVRNC